MARFWKAVVLASSVIILIATLYPLLAKADNGAPPIPHGISGQEACLTCHGPAGLAPVPASHSSYTEDTCQMCHAPAAAAPASAGSTPPPQEAPSVTPAAEPAPNAACLACHAQPGLSMKFPSGETLYINIDPLVYAASVHGDKLLCTDCHTAISGYPHPKREVQGQRDYSIAQYELCKQCHFDNYTKTLDSIHYQIAASGDTRAPLCTDCHGAHNVTPPSQPRSEISQTCSQCHQGIYQEYIESVHGKALIEDNNYDVPVCTDCHQTHTIEDPRTASFRLKSVHLCSNCHSNEKLMEKYGISPNVVQTYLNDFHGRTVALVEREDRDIWVEEAVCTDCHGSHNIQAVGNPNSPVIKQNLVATCGKCHTDVGVNFPGAWLSHYEPSISKAPLIFFVRWFYRLLIPFILVGLAAHVLLDLWRRITNR